MLARIVLQLRCMPRFLLVLTTLAACTFDMSEPDLPGELPTIPYCSSVGQWDVANVEWEQRLLTLVNQVRARGASCGGHMFGPAPELTSNPALLCAARVHSQDMHDREYFDHINLDGDGPGIRMERAGYELSAWGENIIAGYGSPEAQFEGWMGSPGHCSNIMASDFYETGIGFFYGPKGYRQYATQVFARPIR